MADTADDILAALTDEFNRSVKAGDFDPELDDFMANQVVPVWQDNSPEDTGSYKESVQVTEPAQSGRGQVGATVDYANLIEYGSEHNEEFAPMQKTVEHFNSGHGQ